MTLELQDILAGKRMRGREKQGNASIKDPPFLIQKRSMVGIPWFRQPTKDLLGNRRDRWARDPDNPYTTLSGWCSRSSDGLLCSDAGLRQLLFSILWVIYHCWAMERTLLTTQYSTSPDGKKRKNTVKTKGIYSMIFA